MQWLPVVTSSFCELCNNQEISLCINSLFPSFRWNTTKILKRQREGALLRSWMTPWQSEWGRTPRWSAMLRIKASTLTSWRWTGDLESSSVSGRACSAGLRSHRDRVCPNFRIHFFIVWLLLTCLPRCPAESGPQATGYCLPQVGWDSWPLPGSAGIHPVPGCSWSLITFWTEECSCCAEKRPSYQTWLIMKVEQLSCFPLGYVLISSGTADMVSMGDGTEVIPSRSFLPPTDRPEGFRWYSTIWIADVFWILSLNWEKPELSERRIDQRGGDLLFLLFLLVSQRQSQTQSQRGDRHSMVYTRARKESSWFFKM